MKRMFTLFLTCLLLVSLLPVSVWAAESAQSEKTAPVLSSAAGSCGTEIDVTQYSYTVTPVLAPFSRYIYVQTDNPDPTSFRLVDKSSKYYSPGDKGEICVTRGYGSYSYGVCEAGTYYIDQVLFADVVYEDASAWRVRGGYLFLNQNSEADGGELVLQQITKRGTTIINSKYADTDVTVDCPVFLSAKDYLIDKCTDPAKSFFENMDALQAELDRIARYPRSLYDLDRPNATYPYPLLFASPYEELPLDERYEMYDPHPYGLLLNHAYPFSLNSLSFPGMLKSMAQMLAPDAAVKWTSIHYLIDVTYQGQTKTYGGAGRGGTNPLYTDAVNKAFSFSGNSSDMGTHGTIEKYAAVYDDYQTAADAAAEQYRDLIRGETFDKKIASTGGTWMQVAGWTRYPAFAYCVPVSEEYNVVASDAWVDGKYINKSEIMEPGARYEDHPYADIILHNVSYTDRWGVAHRQDVMYSYDKNKDLWTAPFFYSAMGMYYLNEQLPDALILTPEQAEAAVRAMEPEKNGDSYPTKGLIYDGSVYPGTAFSHVSVTGISMAETLSMVAGSWDPSGLAVTVTPSNATYRDVIWSSSDTMVLFAYTDGGLGAGRTGEVQLTATTVDGRYTATCTVTVTPNIQFEQEPEDTAVTEGEAVTLSCRVQILNGDETPQYQWQQSDDGGVTWTDVGENGTKDALPLTPVLADSGRMFRCRAWNSCGEIFSRAALLTVEPRPYVPIVIVTQPMDVSVYNGETASFTVVAEGEDLTYAWYRKGPDDRDWTPIDGANAGTLTLVATPTNASNRFRCLLRSSAGAELLTDEATLRVMADPPVIETEPESVTEKSGTCVSFSVAATGRNVTYQWYGKAPDAGSWALLDGETAATLTLVASAANDGWQYYCRLQNLDGTEDSEAATLHVLFSAPVVTGQPRSVRVKNGGKATFCVAATGSNLQYQWFRRGKGAEEWAEIPDARGATLTVTAGANDDGAEYYCRVRNEDGEAASDAAALTVELQPPVIKTSPKNRKVKSGAKAAFTVKASGKGLGYQWFRRTDPAGEWEALVGETKATLTFAAVMADDGSAYFCRVTNADGSADSAVAVLTVTPVPVAIKTQPKSTTVKSGAKVKLRVKASGPNLRYQWFVCAPDGDSFLPIAGATGAEYSFTASMAKNGARYRCTVQNEDETLCSDAASLTVTPAPAAIKTQPRDLTVKSGSKAKFSVKATGPNLRYQWYSRTRGEKAWTVIQGATKADYSFTVELADQGRQFRCRVWNDDDALETCTATLTVTPQDIVIRTQPRDVKAKTGGKARFSVKAKGPNLRYQWYYRTSEDGEWILIEGATKAEYSFRVEAPMAGWQFSCRVFNHDDEVGKRSASAALTVE